MRPFSIKLGIVLATVFLALVSLSVIFLVTRVSAANLAGPTGPENPVNEYPSTWVVVVGNTGTLHMVNTASNIVYGPFLAHQMGSESGGLFDVAVTPNGKTALVSNFGDSMVSFVDISNPLSPSLMATATTMISYTDEGDPLDPADDIILTETMYAEDIAITQDGKYALVTDGGLSAVAVVIDIAAQRVLSGSHLGNNYANAVAIAPDGTVVFADYSGVYSGSVPLGGRVHSYLLDDYGQLTYGNTYTYSINSETGEISPTGILTTGWVLPKPVNVGISPDGQTVIMCNSGYYSLTVISGTIIPYYHIGAYRITSPGVLSFTSAVVGLTSGDNQSVAFSATGDNAYLIGNNWEAWPRKFNHITVLDITGPGEISLNNEVAAEIPRIGGGDFLGMDSIAVINNKAYIGHESPAQMSDIVKTSVHVVDLDTFDVLTLTLQGIPSDTSSSMGVAVIPYFIYVPFLILQ